jgi:hypothetical protein
MLNGLVHNANMILSLVNGPIPMCGTGRLVKCLTSGTTKDVWQCNTIWQLYVTTCTLCDHFHRLSFKVLLAL